MNSMENQTTDPAELPEPVVKKKSGPSIVWLIPLLTLVIGGWLIYKTLSEKGPEIAVTFKTAEGIEAGKTQVKYKDIAIGKVAAVHFSDDFSRVILTIKMARGTDEFLRRDTRFWVVKPRLTLRGASNLSTLVSGVYIEIEPGKGAPQRRFTGLDVQPAVKADVAGTKITLLTHNLGSIDTGSPVYYQGILAGEITGWELGNDRKSIFIHAFIKSPYDELVRSDTRFWNASGVDVSLSAEGIKVRTESVQSLLYGGVAFETPESIRTKMEEDVSGLVFTLYDSYESIQETAFTQKVRFILFFDESVRGLTVDAPVEFKGIKIGSVVDVRLEFDNRDTSFRIPVLIEIEPERIIERGADEDLSPLKTLQKLVDRGLRAQLQTGSLLTGQLFVEFDMHPGTPVRLVNAGGPFPELPTIPASLAQMTESMKAILAKLEKVDMEKIGGELLGTLKGTNALAKEVNRLVSRPELVDSINDFRSSLNTLKSILRKLDLRVEPVAENLTAAMEEGRRALEKARSTMGYVDDLLKSDSPLQFRFGELAEELTETARSIRTLVDMLERNPNSLIFGKDASGGE